MKIYINAISDVGKVKSNNEDIALIGKDTLRDNKITREIKTDCPMTMSVADGVGGAEGGEIASELIVTSLLDFVVDLDTSLNVATIEEKLENWAQSANRLLQIRIEKLGNSGMGTTLTGLLFNGDDVIMFNAGDSRVYRWRDGILRQMTRDHSMRELTGRTDVPGNIMYNAFGKLSEFFIDVKNITDQVLQDDIFLICSDGLSDMLPDEMIETSLSANKSVESLVDMAKEAGGKDNITAVVIKIIEK